MWEEVFQHTGIAKVSVNTAKYEVSMHRNPENDVLFTVRFISIGSCPLLTYQQSSEPRFGTFTALLHENFVYAFGHGPNSKDIMLARVPFPYILEKGRYEYFDGTVYQKHISKCKPVMTSMQHGTIYQSRLFQPNTGKDWVFVGCNAFADSTVHMGVAPKPEGPWDIRKLMPAQPKTRFDDATFTYCMFAHPWAYDEGKGEFMVTWSEGTMRGRVVAVKVSLVQSGNGEHGGQNTRNAVTAEKQSLKEKILGKLKSLG
jgi:hypothetical protein